MEISEVVVYLALFLSIALNVLNIDWRNSKTYKNALMIMVVLASGVGLMFLIFGT
ncbi:MAG: hypothetical protein HOF77_02475 [Actinobacteria bacterium]|jgi:hypothetical protein|nr:hypothetical protein [Actinomycetota bacterium]